MARQEQWPEDLRHAELCAWRFGGACDCKEEWRVVHIPTGNVVTTYDSRREAEDAVAWHRETYGGDKLEVSGG